MKKIGEKGGNCKMERMWKTWLSRSSVGYLDETYITFKIFHQPCLLMCCLFMLQSVYALVCLCYCLFIFMFQVESDRVWMAVNVSPLTPKFSDSNFILFCLLSFSKVNRKNQQKLIWSISNLFIIKFLMAVPKLIGCHKNGLL